MNTIQDFLNIDGQYPEHSRVWVFPADRLLSKSESETAETFIRSFLKTWAAHGNQLQAKTLVCYDACIVVAVDEAIEGASGCSIDSLTRKVKELGQIINVNFFDRSKSITVQNGEVKVVDRSSIVSDNNAEITEVNYGISLYKELETRFLIRNIKKNNVLKVPIDNGFHSKL